LCLSPVAELKVHLEGVSSFRLVELDFVIPILDPQLPQPRRQLERELGRLRDIDRDRVHHDGWGQRDRIGFREIEAGLEAGRLEAKLALRLLELLLRVREFDSSLIEIDGTVGIGLATASAAVTASWRLATRPSLITRLYASSKSSK
jgi:hypothetical protein